MGAFRSVAYDTVRKIALAFPDVEEGMSYGTPALKVKGKLFVRLRDELMASRPDVCYTDHYLRYEWIVVRLSVVKPAALRELLEIAYREAFPAKRPPRRPVRSN